MRYFIQSRHHGQVLGGIEIKLCARSRDYRKAIKSNNINALILILID